MQDSAHFKNEQRKQTQTEERIARLKKQAAALTQGQLAGHSRRVCCTPCRLLCNHHASALLVTANSQQHPRRARWPVISNDDQLPAGRWTRWGRSCRCSSCCTYDPLSS